MSKRGEIFQIAKIDATISPELYILRDLLKDKVPGKYYREQLLKAPTPTKEKFFEVEKILGTKKFKGKKYYFVKFLYYSSKFNQYVSEDDLKIG